MPALSIVPPAGAGSSCALSASTPETGDKWTQTGPRIAAKADHFDRIGRRRLCYASIPRFDANNVACGRLGEKCGLEQVRSQGLNLPRIREQAAQKQCPQCGKPMRKRGGQYGSFWGCTGYPACAYTEDVGSKRRRPKKPPTTH